MSTYREAVEQLEALATQQTKCGSLSPWERVGVRDPEAKPKPRRLYALPTPTQPAQEAP